MAFNRYQYDKLRAKRHATKVKHKAEIYEIRHSNDPERKKPQFSKIAVAFIFVDTFVIQIYCMVVMVLFRDISNLGALMGIFGSLLTQGFSYAVYAKKATVENSVNGITYEVAMSEMKANTINNVTDITYEANDAVG